MIENWIDALTKVWEVEDGRGGRVLSYRLFEKDEFPDDVPMDRPVALTFVDRLDRLEYSAGGPSLGYWTGTTEFVLTPELKKSRIPEVLRYFDRIVKAAAANLNLGGSVEYFIIGPNGQAAIEMVVLDYGNKTPRMGLSVNWEVKEHLTGIVV